MCQLLVLLEAILLLAVQAYFKRLLLSSYHTEFGVLYVQVLEVYNTMDISVPLDASMARANDYVDFSLVGLCWAVNSDRSC